MLKWGELSIARVSQPLKFMSTQEVFFFFIREGVKKETKSPHIYNSLRDLFYYYFYLCV